MGRLIHIGRIVLKGTLDSWVRRGLKDLAITTTALTHEFAARAYALPGRFHKDPADRPLVTTAVEHGLTLVTADERILAYPHVITMNAKR